MCERLTLFFQSEHKQAVPSVVFFGGLLRKRNKNKTPSFVLFFTFIDAFLFVGGCKNSRVVVINFAKATSLEKGEAARAKKEANERGAYSALYLVTALVPSETACLASSPGSSRRTAVWTSRDEIVERLL